MQYLHLHPHSEFSPQLVSVREIFIKSTGNLYIGFSLEVANSYRLRSLEPVLYRYE